MTQTDAGHGVATPPIEPVLIEFATGLAHDLSNALNSVGLHADMAKLMLDRGEVDNARRMLDGVQAEFRRNIHLMNALRRFASAPNVMAVTPVALPELLDEARECACLLLDAEPESIGLAPGKTAGEVRVDREAMIYVIVQLIRNAREAGATRVDLDTDGDERGWQLTISDNGPGIDDGMQPRLFGMFASSRREQGHLGLGLWVVDRLCSANGMRIEAHAGAGGGTAFVIRSMPTPAA